MTSRAIELGVVALESRPGQGGGVDLYLRSLVEALADECEAGTVRLSVLTFPETESSWSSREWPPHVRAVTLRRTRAPLSPVRRVARRLGRAVGRRAAAVDGSEYVARQIDAMGLRVLHFPRNLMYPRPVATPSVLTVFDLQHEYQPQHFTPRELADRRRFYAESVAAATLLTTPSRFSRDGLVEKLGVDETRVAIVPVGLDRGFSRVSPAKVDEARARYGLPPDFVVYPANPWPHKNHGRLLAALRSCSGEERDFPPLVLLGRLEGEPRDFQSLAQAAGVEPRVVDLGFVASEDRAAIYSAASFMVFPSLFEGFGMPLIEAMACGCPVAASESSCLPEVAGGCALPFDPEATGEIAHAMLALWRHPEHRAALAARGLERAEQFRWPRVLPRLLEVYARAARGSGGRKPVAAKG